MAWVGVAVVAMTTAACGTAGRPGEEAAAASTADTRVGVDGRSAAPAPGDPAAHDADRGLPELPVPDVTWDTEAADAAVATAVAAVTAFARPAAPVDRWWADLAPLLTPAARTAHTGTDPANVPASAVTGPAGPARSPSPFLATVAVPTDAGTYTVLLVRDDAGAGWLVDRLDPPPDDPATLTP
ncbi:MAG: hypothetical protein ACFCVG_07665 [Kineosporiaceae bacterium]